MPINFIGDIRPAPVERLLTGLYSFDRAFLNSNGDVGFPLNKGIEIFGATHLGKSTVAYSLAGRIAKLQEKGIVLVDFEGFDPQFLEDVLTDTGFSGDVLYLQTKDDESALDEMVVTLRKDNYAVGVLDSIGAISPLAEREGDLGEANMGRRAIIMAQFSRKVLRTLLNNQGKTMIAVNHSYPKVGGRGNVSPGGEVKNYLFTIRIELKRVYRQNKYEEYPDGSYIINGKVVKNRWGIKNREFYLFILAGHGIHTGLTALYDLRELKIVKTIKRTLVMDGNSYGSMKNVIMKAHDGDEEFFVPFIEKLSTLSTDVETEEKDENEEIEEEEDV